MGLLDNLFNQLWTKFITWLGPAGKLISSVGQFFTKFGTATSQFKEIGALVYGEIIAWKNFKEAIPFRTGVISLPAAIEQTQALLDEIISAYHALLDLFTKLKDKLFRAGESSPEQDAAEVSQELESGEGFGAFLKKFPKLAKGLENIAAAVGAIISVMDDVIDVAGNLLIIVQTCKDIREEIETGSTIFLSQKNPRKKLALKDGGSIKVRVGNLHS